MVEVIRGCIECGTSVVTQFNDPVNWDAVNVAVKDKEPRCSEHPAPIMPWYYED